MVLAPITSSKDGARVTVNELLKSPLVIPTRIIELMENEFIADSLLRDGGNVPGGVAEFYQSTPLFANAGSAIKEEFGEYRIVTTSLGIPSVVAAVNRGMSMIVSEEQRRRNQVDRVNQMMTQIRNTMTRDWDIGFQTAILQNQSIPWMQAGTHNTGSVGTPPTGTAVPWNATNATIREDMLAAQKLVTQAVSPVQPLDADNVGGYLGFTPDTMVINPATKYDILVNSAFNNVYQGNLADENLRYTGVLPQKILNVDVLESRTWPMGKVLICQRNTLGFIAEERGLQATPLYEDQKTETWRSDVSRIAAIGIDQPLAAVVVTGV